MSTGDLAPGARVSVDKHQQCSSSSLTYILDRHLKDCTLSILVCRMFAFFFFKEAIRIERFLPNWLQWPFCCTHHKEARVVDAQDTLKYPICDLINMQFINKLYVEKAEKVKNLCFL